VLAPETSCQNQCAGPAKILWDKNKRGKIVTLEKNLCAQDSVVQRELNLFGLHPRSKKGQSTTEGKRLKGAIIRPRVHI